MKKKKKTIYLRKVRITSQNKYRKYFAKKFPKLYDLYFYGEYKGRNRYLYSLMLFFNCMGAHKILNYFKLIGVTKNYQVSIYKKKSIKVERLFKKFQKLEKKYKKKRRAAKILKILFIKKFYMSYNIHRLRYTNIMKKKELCLYFSYRHILILPVRGQRTKTNAKTRKDFNIF